MSRKTKQNAVIYCRVSTKKQDEKGNGLVSQETICREYARQREHNIIAVFTDKLSGKLAKRTGFDEMLSFIRKNRKLGIVVIIDDVSRMARDVRHHFNLKEMIYATGATLESPTWEFKTDSHSIFHEGLMAGLAQYQSQMNAEQARTRMRGRMLQGFWVHNAPMGYKYQKSPAGGSVLVRDEPIASIIAEGLNGYASGRFNSKAEVKRFFESHPEFPLCRHGYLTNQQVHRIMVRELYAGLVSSKEWDISVRPGQHEALISVETFNAIQDRLAGKVLAPARVDIHSAFPLRGWIKCGCCYHPMTANFSKGRNATYAYYICRTKGCERFAKSVARAKVEDAFHDILRRLVPGPELVAIVSKLFHKRWEESEAKNGERRTAAKQEVAAIEKKVASLLDRIMESENRTVIARYESEVEKLEREKLAMLEKTARCGTAAKSFDETFRTAFDFFSNPWNLWENGTFEDRQIVLRLTLNSHLEYDWNGFLRTADLSLPFKALESGADREKQLAERVGFEPTVRLPAQRFSRPPRSTTPAPLRRDETNGWEPPVRSIGAGH